MKNRKIAISGVVIAMYVVLMYLTQSFAFGQYQIRIATALYSLTYVYPFLIIPLGLANMFSNIIMGGLGVFDMIGGFIVGIMTAGFIFYMRRFNLRYEFVFVPILLVPGLVVPVWLSFLLEIPYLFLMASIIVGQIIPSITGVLLIGYILRYNRQTGRKRDY